MTCVTRRDSTGRPLAVISPARAPIADTPICCPGGGSTPIASLSVMSRRFPKERAPARAVEAASKGLATPRPPSGPKGIMPVPRNVDNTRVR